MIPYIAMWSEEATERPYRVLDFLGRVAYENERPGDRDAGGVLWARISGLPGEGHAQLGKVHGLRQREVMRELRCQVCAGPADVNSDGVLWLLHDDRGDWPGWPDDLAATHPPVCLPCALASTRMCPHLRSGFVAVRVKHCPVVGVYGSLYDPRNLDRPIADAIVGYDHPEARWTVAYQLVRKLRGCQLVDLRAERPRSRPASR